MRRQLCALRRGDAFQYRSQRGLLGLAFRCTCRGRASRRGPLRVQRRARLRLGRRHTPTRERSPPRRIRRTASRRTIPAGYPIGRGPPARTPRRAGTRGAARSRALDPAASHAVPQQQWMAGWPVGSWFGVFGALRAVAVALWLWHASRRVEWEALGGAAVCVTLACANLRIATRV